ncbi:hypothetical protein TWF506_008372 [Arthrobotrys conoides]|uniref:F-box domain-containing protein n=1 Tax=Arthrobotrys conoides TaxID=74498 RepID=A0AAN8N5U2_9PEZI
MVTSILFFPNEILSQILGDECLSNGDLGRAECTCKLFRANIQEHVAPRRKYTFWVDSIDRPSWRLVRYLLENPKLGEQFVEINVKWERRIAGNPDTWTKDWKWKGKEISRIRKMCTKWNLNPRITFNILRGKNSEALLPLLLCFTPNLKSLDLGDIDRKIINYNRSEHKLALRALVGSSDEIGPPRGIYSEESQRFMPQNHSLFIFDTLEHQNRNGFLEGSGKLTPGLSNLEHFSLGAPGKDEKPFNAQDLFPVFCFPKIKSIHASGLIDNDDDLYSIAQYKPNSRKVSPVKHLTLETYRRERSTILPFDHLKRIARITRNLETLTIRNRSSRMCESTKKSDEKLARRFLKYNQDTLNPTRLRINGGSFNDAGVYDEDVERREDLARRWRLFEHTQTRSRDLKPSPLLALKPEILSRILSYLKRKDVFNLMLSSKALYEPCYEDIWSGFAFLASYYDLDTDFTYKHSLTDDEAGHLNNVISSIGTTGIRCLENLEVESSFLSDWSHSYEREDVLKHIGKEIHRGEAPKFKSLHLNFASYGFSDRSLDPYDDQKPGPDFLSAVKQYSEQKSCQEFSLRIQMNIQSAALFSRCDITKLTNLQLDARFRRLRDAKNELTEFTSLLAAVSGQLKVLTLGGNHYGKRPKGLNSLWEPLEALQQTVSSLKSVTSFTVKHGYLFHPSFLLLPPENVKVLSYVGRMSPSWWRKFAKHPFTGVERLNLSCDGLQSHEARSLKLLGEETYKSSVDFQLEGLEISGLKWLSINENERSVYPADFFERALKNNSQLSPYCLQAIVKNKRDVFTKMMKAKMPHIIKTCGNQLSQQLTKALEGYTQDFATEFLLDKKPLQMDFEKIMEDSSLERLIKQFENEYGPSFVSLCSETLRKHLGKNKNEGKADKKSPGDSRLSESSESDFSYEEAYSDDTSDDDDDDEDSDGDNGNDNAHGWADDGGSDGWDPANGVVDRIWATGSPVSYESAESPSESEDDDDDDYSDYTHSDDETKFLNDPIEDAPGAKKSYI